MAEFAEVMHQWKRMCNANSYCDTCRMQRENLPYTLCSEGGIRSVENFADAELAIMAWAKEHPEPVYPTWYRWLIMMGAISSVEDIFEDLQHTIPADIAESLGIKGDLE